MRVRSRALRASTRPADEPHDTATTAAVLPATTARPWDVVVVVGMMQSLFGATGAMRSKQPQEQLREWQATLRSEQRKLDRQIRGARPRAT